jgi:hypothetical protein
MDFAFVNRRHNEPINHYPTRQKFRELADRALGLLPVQARDSVRLLAVCRISFAHLILFTLLSCLLTTG